MGRDQTQEDLVNHLREQYGFLVVSAELFDHGSEAEAKRIAVVVRTLVHDTDSSHSLLEQLGYKQRAHFVAQNYTYKPWNNLMFHGLVGLVLPAEGPRFVPHLDMLVPRLLPLTSGGASRFSGPATETVSSPGGNSFSHSRTRRVAPTWTRPSTTHTPCSPATATSA